MLREESYYATVINCRCFDMHTDDFDGLDAGFV